MKYVLSPRIIKLGEVVAKIPFAKSLLKPVYYPYKDWLNKKRNKEFLRNGIDTLNAFAKCAQEAHVEFTLGFGTLLGAVRNKGFLKHDLDIDVCMWYRDYTDEFKNLLIKEGFNLIRSFSIDNGENGMEVTYVYNNVSIDIFFIYPPINKLPYTCHCWDPVGNAKTRDESMKLFKRLVPSRFETEYDCSILWVDFENTKMPIPSEYDKILTQRYGSDYMTPNPNFVDGPQYMSVRWDDANGVLITYKD